MIIDKKRKFPSAVVCAGASLSIAVFAILMFYKAQGSMTTDPTNPYYQTFSPIALISSLLKYCTLCFDLQSGGWNYVRVPSGTIGTALILFGLVIAVFRAFRLKFGLLFCYIAIAFSIAVVLPQINQVHVLYLYFPAIFVGLLLAGVLSPLLSSGRGYAVTMLVFFSLCFALSAPGNRSTQEYWLSIAQMEQNAWDDILEIPAPVSESTIYIRNVDGIDYTPFFYGHGGVCNLLYGDDTFKVELVSADEEIVSQTPYVIWNYENGRIYEIERNDSRYLDIISVYPNKLVVPVDNDNDGIAFAITPNPLSDSLRIFIDEEEFVGISGDDFISTTIPVQFLQGKDLVTVQIVDKYGTKSTLKEIAVIHKVE